MLNLLRVSYICFVFFIQKGDTALHIAVRSRYAGLCEALLKDQKNSRLLYKPNKAGETPYNIDRASKSSVLSAVFGNSKSQLYILFFQDEGTI